MLSLLSSLIAGGLTGLLAGTAVAWLLLRHGKSADDIAVEPADPFISAELDRAAVKWATDAGQPPQAASLMADKLHLLYALGRRHRP